MTELSIEALKFLLDRTDFSEPWCSMAGFGGFATRIKQDLEKELESKSRTESLDKQCLEEKESVVRSYVNWCKKDDLSGLTLNVFRLWLTEQSPTTKAFVGDARKFYTNNLVRYGWNLVVKGCR